MAQILSIVCCTDNQLPLISLGKASLCSKTTLQDLKPLINTKMQDPNHMYTLTTQRFPGIIDLHTVDQLPDGSDKAKFYRDLIDRYFGKPTPVHQIEVEHAVGTIVTNWNPSLGDENVIMGVIFHAGTHTGRISVLNAVAKWLHVLKSRAREGEYTAAMHRLDLLVDALKGDFAVRNGVIHSKRKFF
jgi:hypothetical protein